MDYLRAEGRYTDRSAWPMASLLILDLKMPRKNGFQVLEEVRKDPLLRPLPVVILTGSPEQQDVDRAHDLGANGYCVKPCGTDEYEQLVEGLEKYWLRQHQFPTLPDGRTSRGTAAELAPSAHRRL